MIGHTAARLYLERNLPPAVLLTGPASVGKWTLAAHLAEHHQVRPVDRWDAPHGLTVSTVRLISDHLRRAPLGRYKLVLARLDASKPAALNALLKTLEEPTPFSRFLLVSSSATLPTVASRCTRFELGRLTPQELAQIYRSKGMPESKAHRCARLAAGQVQRGLSAEQGIVAHNQVVNLTRALSCGDRELYSALFRTWDESCTEALTTFFTECLTQQWRNYTEQEANGLHRDRTRLWQMVTAVGRLSHTRPRLGVRVALEPFLLAR